MRSSRRNRKKIVFFHVAPQNYGGAEEYAVQMARAARESGFNVLFLIIGSNGFKSPRDPYRET